MKKELNKMMEKDDKLQFHLHSITLPETIGIKPKKKYKRRKRNAKTKSWDIIETDREPKDPYYRVN